MVPAQETGYYNAPKPSDIDKSAMALTSPRSYNDSLPVYESQRTGDANVNTNYVPAAPVPFVPAPAPMHYAIPLSAENEWQATLQELQNNLTALRDARHGPPLLGHSSSRFMRNLFSSSSFRSKRMRHGRKTALELHEDAQRVRVLEELVLTGMRKLARIHPDPNVQAEWNSRADQFARAMGSSDGALAASDADRFAAAEKDKESILEGITKGLIVLFMAPVALAGAVVFTAGAMLFGSGKFIIGLGHLMTFGKFK